jgi:hypothetical protein
MEHIKKQNQMDKKQLIRQSDHLTIPPRMEGKVKNAGINPVKKKKRKA